MTGSRRDIRPENISRAKPSRREVTSAPDGPSSLSLSLKKVGDKHPADRCSCMPGESPTNAASRVVSWLKPTLTNFPILPTPRALPSRRQRRVTSLAEERASFGC
jgi:hypothetical protein